MTMLPLMVMEMEAQSFNRQGVEAAQSLLNKQGIEVMTSVGYANNVGYEGINMEPLSTLFRGEGGWGDYNIPSYYSNSNNNNYDISHVYQPHSDRHHHRLLQEDGDNGAMTTDGNIWIIALSLMITSLHLINHIILLSLSPSYERQPSPFIYPYLGRT